MSVHILEPFFRGLGHQVVSRHGVLWIDVGRFTLITVPSSQRLSVSREEIQQLLSDTGRLVAVFACTGGVGVPCTDFWVRDTNYSLHSLQDKFRANVIRNEHRFDVRRLPWDELRQRGLSINRQTMERRGVSVHPSLTASGWSEICAQGERTAGLEATGCFLGDELTGFLISWISEGVCYVFLWHSERRFSAWKASNVLLYRFTAQMLSRPDVQSISMGRGFLPPHESLDRFKRHAGYVDETLELAVILHRRFEGILSAPWTRRILNAIDWSAGGRLGLSGDLQILEAAVATTL